MDDVIHAGERHDDEFMGQPPLVDDLHLPSCSSSQIERSGWVWILNWFYHWMPENSKMAFSRC